MTRMDAGITPEQFELLLPLACQWAAAQEQRICSHGQALSDAQLADARLVGVAEPERVRILCVLEIPIPEHPALRAAADRNTAYFAAHGRANPAVWHFHT